MPTVPADFKPFAFKEWQVICDALESGEQSIILRKGGISEGKHGFQWLHERFFLFPTFFHEQSNQVLPDAEGTLRSFRPQRSGGEEIEIRLFAETLETTHLTDWDEIAALAPQHLWTEQVIRERYEWGDEEKGIGLAKLRIWRLPEPWILKDRKGFGGCRSWIGLPADEHPDLAGALAAAESVK